MQKLPLRPLRLTRLHPPMADAPPAATEQTAEVPALENGVLLPSSLPDQTPISSGDTGAQQLLKRTPNNYLLNQIYGLWQYISLFLLTLLLTHTIGKPSYGVFAATQTAANTIMYIVALGLEDAIATFLPRVYSTYGKASAAQLIRRLLAMRLGVLLISTLVILRGLPTLAVLIALIPIKGSTSVASALTDPTLLIYTAPIAVYVLGTGITNIFGTVCAALMRVQGVLLISGLAQLVLLPLSFLAVRAGWSVNGVLWTQAILSVLSALAFAAWFAPLLLTRGATVSQPFKPVLQLGISAWQTNLVSGALLKQVAIILIAAFAARMATSYIADFSLAFQLADAANLLLVSGFSGVGGSALAAAFIGDNYERLARIWQALIKVETLLAAPGLIFCLFNASAIVIALYGPPFAAVGPLMVIFLIFNILVRVLGTTIHQSSLYVIGLPRLVVVSQWLSMGIAIAVGIVLIPGMGPAGALISDGLARTFVGVALLFLLLRKLPPHYPRMLLGFSFRFLSAVVLAALPGILWHPANRYLLGVSGMIFLLLCAVLLSVIKPLTSEDSTMLAEMNPRIARYLRWFVRTQKS